MRAFAVVVVLAVFAICHASPVKKEERNDILVQVYGYKHGDPCPAKLFYDDCNQCFCTDSGNSAACTPKACPSQPEEEAVKLVKSNHPHNYSLTFDCEPNKQFMDICNICKCNPDGKAASCTHDMVCPSVDKDKKCLDLPGQTFQDRCNTCSCDADGKPLWCTLAGCPEYE